MKNKFRPLMVNEQTHALLSHYFGKGRMAATVADLVVKATCQHPKDERIMLRVSALEGKDTVPATGFWCKQCEQIVSNLKDML